MLNVGLQIARIAAKNEMPIPCVIIRYTVYFAKETTTRTPHEDLGPAAANGQPEVHGSMHSSRILSRTPGVSRTASRAAAAQPVCDDPAQQRTAIQLVPHRQASSQRGTAQLWWCTRIRPSQTA